PDSGPSSPAAFTPVVGTPRRRSKIESSASTPPVTRLMPLLRTSVTSPRRGGRGKRLRRARRALARAGSPAPTRTRPPREGGAGGSEQERAQTPFEDRTGPRGWWLHRRRLRDRRPASPRPAGGQPDHQRVRRVRGDQRGGVRRQHGGQRDHARGDDEGDQQ